MNDVSRRRFTQLLLVGTGVNLAAGAAMEVYLLPDGRFRELVSSALLKRAGDLGFKPDDFERFLSDYCSARRPWPTEAILSYGWPIYRWTSLLERSEAIQSKLENWEERLVTQFLLSTDYFAPGRTKDPMYVALYAPGLRPCRNPFARQRTIDG